MAVSARCCCSSSGVVPLFFSLPAAEISSSSWMVRGSTSEQHASRGVENSCCAK